ncbi:pilus assembly protein CpaE [Enterobacter asburiae]|uniref:tight adherance operon protein n=1 Tax=Enterobacter asburiae TaxID=61645 RepID=UPI00141BEA1C|nr:tight adherance operon protein [Enterobacter asburiae]NIH92215.1 pilus assembly protein CpaE [Enterobacter asburiae]
MLLFQQKKTDDTNITDRKLYVISERYEVREQLCQLFRLAGFHAVEDVPMGITQMSTLAIPENTNGVVIDIADNIDVAGVVNSLQIQVPRNVWCCVVGDSDSISLAQSFARNHIGYFNRHTQQDMAVEAALSGAEYKYNRSAINITILGCKGGIGATTIAWQLAEELAQQKQLPILFMQGSRGSHDLDLIIGKKLSQDITAVGKNLDVMSTVSDYPNVEHDTAQRYNFAVFEQSIATADKEMMRLLAEKSRCMVLIIDRSLSSVRVACNMIENTEQLRRNSPTPRRLLICLNDTRPVAEDSLSLVDIKNLLDNPIDIHFCYSRRNEPSKLVKKRQFHTSIIQLTRVVLGDKYKPVQNIFSRLSALLQRDK